MKMSALAEGWAKSLHRETNHLYDGKPYGFHLDMVNNAGLKFKHLIPEDMIEKVFAAIWMHDTIEDCRVTYNDVKEQLGTDVAEIVYAVTNEKGRNRKERANDKYYAGIKNNLFAVFVKCCDRIANMEHSILSKSRMGKMYAEELGEFRQHLYNAKFDAMFFYMERMCAEIA